MILELKNVSKYYGNKEYQILKFEKEKSINKNKYNENDKPLINFRLSQISSELSIAKDGEKN